MNLGEWEVYIQPYPWANTNYIFLARQLGHGREYITKNGERLAVQDGEALQTEECCFAKMEDAQLQAFADALSRKGVKTSNDHRNEGLLEATRYHLEDMRKIAFRSKK